MKATIYFQRRGFSLIEMMIALVILSIGLLGIAALQSRGQQFNHAAYVRTQATLSAYEIMDMMRMNFNCANDVLDTDGDGNSDGGPDGNAGCLAVQGYVANVAPADPGCDTKQCSVLQLRDNHLNRWFARLDAVLPGNPGDHGKIEWNVVPNGNLYRIEIRWAVAGDDVPYSQVWLFRP